MAANQSTGHATMTMMNDNLPEPPEEHFQPLGLRQLLEHLCPARQQRDPLEASTTSNDAQSRLIRGLPPPGAE